MDQLPQEIVKEIIALGSLETFVALRLVNRRLRSMCSGSSNVTFAAKNCGGTRHQHSWRWYVENDIDRLLGSETGIQWVFGDVKARRAVEDGPRFKVTSDSWRWVVPVVVTNHPAKDFLLNAVEDAFKSTLHIPDEHLSLALLCFAMIPLQVSPFGLPYFDRRLAMRRLWPKGTRRAVQSELLDRQLLRTSERYERIPFWWKFYAQLIVTIADFYSKVTQNEECFALIKCPLAGLLQLQAPFSSTSSQSFTTSCITSVTSLDFLNDGKQWLGSCCNSFPNKDWPQFDPMMEDISFEAVEEEGQILLTGSGEDERGTFKLQGEVSKITALIRMRKTYDHGRPERWIGAVTPFGIVGSWGDPTRGGWFWLWKRDWCVSREWFRENWRRNRLPSSWEVPSWIDNMW